MITFKLNGKEVQGEEGEYILQVAQRYNVDIPTLCYHKALEPAGSCRLCTVELYDGRRTVLSLHATTPYGRAWRSIQTQKRFMRAVN